MAEIINDENICTGCGLCAGACPFGAIAIKDGKAAVDGSRCTLCGACVKICPAGALKMTSSQPAAPLRNLSSYKDVWVLCEQKDGKVQPVAYELLGEGRKLADKLGVRLCAVLLGNGIEEEAVSLGERGADTVYLAEHPSLAVYMDEPYSEIITLLAEEYRPEIILCGATTVGRSLVSRVAVRLGTGLTADCTGLDIDTEKRLLLQTRPAFGGNIMATIITPRHRPQMATVRHKVMREAEVVKGKKAEIVRKTFPERVYGSRAVLIRSVAETAQTVNISEADVIVAGGRRVGSRG